MKCALVLCALVAVAVAGEYYDTKYDDFDVQTLVENKRLLKSYANCFSGDGPCTAEGADFKRVLPEALQTTCGKCNEKQKEKVRVVVKALQKDLPDKWTQILKQKDPEGKYIESFDAFIAAH